MHRSDEDAVRFARGRRSSGRGPVGVAVRRAWIDGEADGAKAKVVMTDGRTDAKPARAVLVPRVMRQIDAAVIEDALEDLRASLPGR